MLTPTNYALTTDELISLAIQNYNIDANTLEFEKKLELLFIRAVFSRLNRDEQLNFIIFKDATASALQLLTLVLNVTDHTLTKVFNLNSFNT